MQAPPSVRVILSFSEQDDIPIKVEFDVAASNFEPQPLRSYQPPDREKDIETSAKAVLNDIMDQVCGSLDCEPSRKCHCPEDKQRTLWQSWI